MTAPCPACGRDVRTDRFGRHLRANHPGWPGLVIETVRVGDPLYEAIVDNGGGNREDFMDNEIGLFVTEAEARHHCAVALWNSRREFRQYHMRPMWRNAQVSPVIVGKVYSDGT